MLTLALPDIAATTHLAAQLASQANIGDAILLKGDLGVGKTEFCRAFIHAALKKPEDVPSPTFSLVQTFQGIAYPIWHFDLYRLKHQDEVLELGIEEAFSDGVSLIEWPELVESFLPENYVCITLSYGIEKESRVARLSGSGTWETKLENL